jgi:hypothetical protein
MILDARRKHVGVTNIDVAKLFSFGIDGVNVL